jgi:hypothetical protein
MSLVASSIALDDPVRPGAQANQNSNVEEQMAKANVEEQMARNECSIIGRKHYKLSGISHLHGWEMPFFCTILHIFRGGMEILFNSFVVIILT